MNISREKVIILDFGSQYTQLIARRVRSHSVYSEILPFSVKLNNITNKKVKGIILSGGPHSVYERDAPLIKKTILKLGIPVLGICYGHQLLAHIFGGEVEKTQLREYGFSYVIIDRKDKLLSGVQKKTQVWMSHGDRILKTSNDFLSLAHTKNTNFAIVKHKKLPLYGLQFHPEVTHTKMGNRIIANFLFSICKCKGDWNMGSFIGIAKSEIKRKVGTKKIILGLSGGVDSAVTSVLIKQAVGEKLFVVFINNGLLRKNESRDVRNRFAKLFCENFIYVDARKKFLHELREVRNPERKRKIIGKTFIKLFEKEANEIKDVKFLAQGTLYPDRIESNPIKGPSSVIKSHHNVGGLPKKMKLTLIEPLKDLFKDEVREVGKLLNLPNDILNRHPFPGPGLGVRIVGPISKQKLKILKSADYIFLNELKRKGLYSKIWQAFCVLLPVKTVGVMGDKRTYEFVIALRAVTSKDGMTADWYPFSKLFLTKVANKIINEVPGVNRVVYDVSSKPPATIEWE